MRQHTVKPDSSYDTGMVSIDIQLHLDHGGNIIPEGVDGYGTHTPNCSAVRDDTGTFTITLNERFNEVMSVHATYQSNASEKLLCFVGPIADNEDGGTDITVVLTDSSLTPTDPANAGNDGVIMITVRAKRSKARV